MSRLCFWLAHQKLSWWLFTSHTWTHYTIQRIPRHSHLPAKSSFLTHHVSTSTKFKHLHKLLARQQTVQPISRRIAADKTLFSIFEISTTSKIVFFVTTSAKFITSHRAQTKLKYLLSACCNWQQSTAISFHHECDTTPSFSVVFFVLPLTRHQPVRHKINKQVQIKR